MFFPALDEYRWDRDRCSFCHHTRYEHGWRYPETEPHYSGICTMNCICMDFIDKETQ